MLKEIVDAGRRTTGQENSTRREQKTIQWLLTIIAIVLAAGALKIMSSVVVPLALALFLVAVFWPLQRRFQQQMPHGLATGLTLVIFLLVVGLFVGALWWSAYLVGQTWPQYAEQFNRYVDQARIWAQSYGISLPGGVAESGAGQADSGSTGQLLWQGTVQIAGITTGFLLMFGFLLFGLLEVGDFRTKLDRMVPGKHLSNWLDVIHEITGDFQRYIVVRTAIGLITGTLVGIFCLIIGLDFAFIWGLTNFLLNYIPTLGSVIAVIPPVLFALVQYQSIGMALLVLLGVGGVQLIMGQYVDPWLQGKYLALSPLVVLFSVTFWGWLLGVVGAFISVPLTILVVLACNQFDRTRWIATLLADTREMHRSSGGEKHAS